MLNLCVMIAVSSEIMLMNGYFVETQCNETLSSVRSVLQAGVGSRNKILSKNSLNEFKNLNSILYHIREYVKKKNDESGFIQVSLGDKLEQYQVQESVQFGLNSDTIKKAIIDAR